MRIQICARHTHADRQMDRYAIGKRNKQDRLNKQTDIDRNLRKRERETETETYIDRDRYRQTKR